MSSIFLRVVVCLSLSLVWTSCGAIKSGVQAKVTSRPDSEIVAVVTKKALSGEPVALVGTNLKADKTYYAKFSGEGLAVETSITITSAEGASFVMPEGLGRGERTFNVTQGSKDLGTFKIFVEASSSALALYTGDAGDICSDKRFLDSAGTEKNGTRDCAAGNLQDCTSNGQLNCKTTASYKAADLTNLNAANIISGVTIAGTPGSLVLPADCSSDGAIGCVTTASYKSADMTVATAGNIRSSVTIAGQAGNYPSGSFPLPGASVTADYGKYVFLWSPSPVPGRSWQLI